MKLLISITLSFLVFTNTACSHEESFNDFWEHFKTELVEGNYNNLHGDINFPLKLLGEMDHTPAVFLEKKDVNKYLAKVMKEEVVDYRDGQIYRSSLRATLKNYLPTVEKDKLTETDWRIHDFYFRKIDGEWKLVTLYHNEYEEEAAQ
jgi:hypothetical protein